MRLRIVILIFAFVSCQEQDYEDNIQQIFNNLDQDEKSNFKRLEIDSLGLFIDVLDFRVNEKNNEYVTKALRQIAEDTLHITKYRDASDLLKLSLFFKAHNKNIDFTEIEHQYIKYRENRTNFKLNEKEEIQRDMAGALYSEVSVGDTIELTFGLDKIGNRRYVYYNYYEDLNILYSNNGSVKIGGIIVEKYLDNSKSPIHYLILKTLKMDVKNLYFDTRKLEVGDSIKVDLNLLNFGCNTYREDISYMLRRKINRFPYDSITKPSVYRIIW